MIFVDFQLNRNGYETFYFVESRRQTIFIHIIFRMRRVVAVFIRFGKDHTIQCWRLFAFAFIIFFSLVFFFLFRCIYSFALFSFALVLVLCLTATSFTHIHTVAKHTMRRTIQATEFWHFRIFKLRIWILRKNEELMYVIES